MHLVINATEVGRRRGGNESYIRGLLAGLSALHTRPETTLLTCDWEMPLNVPDGFRRLGLGQYRRLPFFLWQQTRAVRRFHADWYLSNYFLPLILPCRGIVIVHDMSFCAHPEYYPRFVAWYMACLTARAVRQARWVVTVSEFSRREILRFYHLDPGKVVVIPNGIGAEFHPGLDNTASGDESILKSYGVSVPYILALGNIHPRKNLSRLLDAYLMIKEQRSTVPPMVWVGIERWASAELVQRAKSVGVHLTGFVAQEHLPALYRQATMLVYPSLYEGFGLPPVEAMACGTPVIASNTTSLPEVVGHAGILVDPKEAGQIAGAMIKVLDDAPLRQALRDRALERAQDFSWQETARQLVGLMGRRGSSRTAQTL